MNTLSTIALFVAMFLVLAVLGMGLFSMVKGGEFNKKYGNKLMQARVIMQGVALALLALAYYTSQTS
ncbi:MAG: twin transmembrane helix small protein [Alphaproteobacteria bacterium]|nr:twin transmembrane helix small protein [Alphaproteobacteria bacterium]|tara:strand:- start:74 stop:274 length:201 start_codon:yes stop_codon:yes gene_type:complete